MFARDEMRKLTAGMAMLSAVLLSACATPGASLSSKGDVAFEVPEDLCSLPDPTPEMVRELRQRPDYAEILIALGRACPERADLFGIGATASIPSLTMVEEDGSPGFRITRNLGGPGRDVDPPDDVPVEEDPGVVIDPPAEPSPGVL